jgi:hypothetical protein
MLSNIDREYSGGRLHLINDKVEERAVDARLTEGVSLNALED